MGKSSATLLTSVPLVAKKADIPDTLFDELFGDWSTPMPSKQAPIVEDQRPAGFCLESCPNVDGTAGFCLESPNVGGSEVRYVMPSQQTQKHAEVQRSTWGTLGVVDDIFAELNRL